MRFCLPILLVCTSIACSNKDDDNTSNSEDAGAEDPTSAKTPEPIQLPALDWREVEFSFVSPADANQFNSGKIDIEVTISKFPVQGRWSLFYNQSANSTEGATKISGDLTTETTKVSWDTSELDPGVYYLFAQLKYGSKMNVRFLGSALQINEDGDNRSPFVKLCDTKPGDEIFRFGVTETIDFIVSDPDGDDVTLALELSADDGATWSSVDSELTSDPGGDLEVRQNVNEDLCKGEVFRYQWQSPTSGDDGIYRVRVIGTDSSGKKGDAFSDGFGLSASRITFDHTGVQNIIQNKCATGDCHQNAAPDGRTRWRMFDNYFSGGGPQYQGLYDRRSGLLSRTRKDVSPAEAMPPPAQLPAAGDLTDAERDLIQMFRWSLSESPNDNDSRSGRVAPTVTITAPTENQVVSISAGTLAINWTTTGTPDEIVVTIDPSDGPEAVESGALAGGVTSYNWDISGIDVSDGSKRWDVRVYVIDSVSGRATSQRVRDIDLDP